MSLPLAPGSTESRVAPSAPDAQDRPGGQVRMEDVARIAGVSPITVSRALSKPDMVSPRSREAVARAIAATGYVRNLVAGSLASQKTHVVAAVVPTFANPVFAATLVSMEAALQAKGFHLMLGQSGATPQTQHALISTFLARRPDGFFLHGNRCAPETRRMLVQAGIPIVEGANLRDDPIDMLVSFSNFDAAKALTRHLIDRGYRRIGFASPPWRHNDRARARRRGYIAALADAGLAVSERRIVETPLGFREGGEALRALLERDKRLDACFLAGDVLAAGALFECHRSGRRVPDDMGIAGFDDQDIASATSPQITTVHVPRQEIGRIAAEMILARIDGRADVDRRVDVGFDIRVRQST